MAVGGGGVMASQTIIYTLDPALSYFPTPPETADDLVYQALTPGHGQGEAANGVPQVRILEPSAGEGHLARAVRDYLPYAHLTAVEPSPQRVPALHNVADVVVATTLEDYLVTVAMTALGGGWEPFDLVVMNPPYTLAGRPEAWAEHLLAVVEDPHLLAPGGMVAAIVPWAVVRGKSRLARRARDLLGDVVGRYSDGEVIFRRGRVQPCERGAFDPVGAGIRPVMVWIEKPSAVAP
ncbi:class I SAM-dependent methyltransferase [Micromonospora sp. WMMD1102]|uniref:class I SAM-dependent methyltransferase n=1 Tax=Micromonospora sp. WMMD1102 TaxID=3016105 RepID=UPI002414F6D5|nr:class I SAM-dependent methyltransferase [Micromonospora sp. WMMD1102]MDG4791928.1 class I SAM-dependent methyltransferase [Micromonospora sp. WMMD1102]